MNRSQVEQIKNVLISNKLRVAITNQCNLSCSYCHNEGQSHFEKKRFLPLEYIKTMVEWFLYHNIYIERLSITGGEPFLHPCLIEIVQELNKITNKLLINTNGIHLTNEWLDVLRKQNVALKIGVDSITSDQTKPNMHTESKSVDNLISVVKYAVNNGNEVMLSTVFSKFNCESLDALIEWAMDAKVKSVKIIKLNDFDSRRLNNRDDIAEEHKTNQPERGLFFSFREKYINKAWRTDDYRFKGKVRVFLRQDDDTEFELLFCDDVCSTGACANIFTGIDSCGNLMICPKYQITIPIDFRGDYASVTETIVCARNLMCDSYKNRFALRDAHGNFDRSDLKDSLCTNAIKKVGGQ